MYNHCSLFDDSTKTIDFDRRGASPSLIRRNYFDEVEAENLLVAIQTINNRKQKNGFFSSIVIEIGLLRFSPWMFGMLMMILTAHRNVTMLIVEYSVDSVVS